MHPDKGKSTTAHATGIGIKGVKVEIVVTAATGTTPISRKPSGTSFNADKVYSQVVSHNGEKI
jgi:hypothetical protein